MSNALFLPAALEALGASVRLIDGWETRSARSTLNPQYLVCHHTASVPWSSEAANLSVCVNGNSVAPGPISQTLLHRSGVIDMIAAGSANHAGAGTYPDGTSGNGRSYGIEAVNAGISFTWNATTKQASWGGNNYSLTTSSNDLMKKRADLGEIVQAGGIWWEPWPEKQLLGYIANVLGYVEHHGWDLDRVISHQQYAPARKIDPSGPWFDEPTTNLTAKVWMGRFKSLIGLVTTTPPPEPPPITEEDDMTKVRFKGYNNVFLLGAGGYTHITIALDAHFKAVPLVVSELHSQGLQSALHQCGLTMADMIPSGEPIVWVGEPLT
jgi:hypothetical protein